MTVGFHHGALADSYEEQALAQGFTLGEDAPYIQLIGQGICEGHISGCITDAEYSKILKRFQEKVIVKSLKKLR